MKKVFLCAISNIRSGSCSEDCRFCSQSSRYKADIDRYSQKTIDTVLQEAKNAINYGALGFCLVTSGKELDNKTLEFVSKIAKQVKKSFPELHLIACNGIASKEALIELKNSGIDTYNHNIESSQNFYPNISTTIKWEERLQTCLNVKSVGLELCSGAIYGVGESSIDRDDILSILSYLQPRTSPINFFHPNPALPLQNRVIDREDGLNIIKNTKERLKNTIIMVAGGREIVFGNNWCDIFDYGCDSIIIGNYLTTSGNSQNRDIEDLRKSNIEILKSC